ncbi:MAG: CBS domain-containing protein [Nitrospirales bacterium]|nr:CBS domain-containing protein [Nitrospirales bacterium]
MADEKNGYDVKNYEIGDEDLRAALREMKSYIDVTEEDLKKIYAIALRHARERLAQKVAVGEAMTRDVISIKGDADIHKVSSLLAQHRISGLPVVDEENRVIGVVTEADVLSMAGIGRGHTFKDVIRHILGEPLPKHTVSACLVREVMTSPAITTTSDADIRDVATVLNEKRIKRLPVVDDRGTLIGVISRADVVRVMGDAS